MTHSFVKARYQLFDPVARMTVADGSERCRQTFCATISITAAGPAAVEPLPKIFCAWAGCARCLNDSEMIASRLLHEQTEMGVLAKAISILHCYTVFNAYLVAETVH
jgi:hypothetical protein